jgi:ubiquinone/menaquinone biosynthesis C-methylase UbiE
VIRQSSSESSQNSGERNQEKEQSSDGAWYERSFGRDYLKLYAHRDASEARSDIEAVVRLLSPPKDEPLLDLCCGACRHLLVLREMGFSQLVGLDLSGELLDVAAQDLERACTLDGQSPDVVCLVQSDMRSIPYENYFATVLSLFTSFGYFVRDADNQAALNAVYAALKPGGRYLIDYLNREYVITHLVAHDECVLEGMHVDNVRCLTDGCQRVAKTTTITMPSGETRVYQESVRMYSRDEMVDMVQMAGLVNVRAYGSLNGEPFGPESRRLILVAEKSTANVRQH